MKTYIIYETTSFSPLFFLSSSLLLVLPVPSHLAVLFFTADGAQALPEVTIYAHDDVQNPASHVRNTVVLKCNVTHCCAFVQMISW